MTEEDWEKLLLDLGTAIGEILRELREKSNLYPKEIGLDPDQNIVILMHGQEPSGEVKKVDKH